MKKKKSAGVEGASREPSLRSVPSMDVGGSAPRRSSVKKRKSTSSMLSASSFMETTASSVHFAGVFADEDEATRTVSAQEENYDKAAKLIRVFCTADADIDVQGDLFEMRFAMIKVLRENVVSWELESKDTGESSAINAAIFEFYGAATNKALDIFMSKHCDGAVRSGNDRYDLYFALSSEEAREACENENPEVMAGAQTSTLDLLLGAHTVENLNSLMMNISPPTPPLGGNRNDDSGGDDDDGDDDGGRAGASHRDMTAAETEDLLSKLLAKVSACEKSAGAFAERAKRAAGDLGVPSSTFKDITETIQSQLELVSTIPTREIVASILCPTFDVTIEDLDTDAFSGLVEDLCDFARMESAKEKAERKIDELARAAANPAEDVKYTESDELTRAKALSKVDFEVYKRESMEDDHALQLALLQSKMDAIKSGANAELEQVRQKLKAMEAMSAVSDDATTRMVDELEAYRKALKAKKEEDGTRTPELDEADGGSSTRNKGEGSSKLQSPPQTHHMNKSPPKAYHSARFSGRKGSSPSKPRPPKEAPPLVRRLSSSIRLQSTSSGATSSSSSFISSTASSSLGAKPPPAAATYGDNSDAFKTLAPRVVHVWGPNKGKKKLTQQRDEETDEIDYAYF